MGIGIIIGNDYLLVLFVHYSLYYQNTNSVKKMLYFVIFAATAIIGLIILLFFALKDSGKEVWQGTANTT